MQVSTCFVNSDRHGYVEEKLYKKKDVNWQADYEMVSRMTDYQVDANQKSITRDFPDVYCYSKRMAEHLLAERNMSSARPIKLVYLRPSILAASSVEPVPGWTDTQGILSGLTLALGLGVLKHMPGNPEGCIDVMPVDYSAHHLITSIAFASIHPESLSKDQVLVVQSSSSANNPITYQKFFKSVIKYQNNFPYERRAGPASL